MRNDNEPYYLASVEARKEVTAELDCKCIQFMRKDELFALQKQLRLGESWGVISSPKEWLAPGPMKASSNVNINHVCIDATSDTERELAILIVTRLALLLFLVPVFGRRWRTLLSVSTVLSYLRVSLPLIRVALARPVAAPARLFSRLSAVDLEGIASAKEKAVLMDHLVAFAKHGYWYDVPCLDDGKKEEASRSANARYGREKRKRQEWQPLPDNFVAAAGWRMIWIAKTLGPALLSNTEGLIDEYQKTISSSVTKKTQVTRLRGEIAKQYLANCVWTSADGTLLSGFPFEFHSRYKWESGKNFEWPPRYLTDVHLLLRLLQTAHLFLLWLSTGARASEALGIEAERVTQAPRGNAVLNGATFKPSSLHEGRKKDWPLPPLVVFAIEQQERLSKAIEALKPWSSEDDDGDLEGNSLFVSLKTGCGLGNGYNAHLKNAIASLKLDVELDERGLHSHRFRKTLARLGALAIIGAPKIFMDLFDHENVETTLNYMMTDPLLQAEMQEIRRAEVIMMAEKAIEAVNENGGPAAAKVKAAVQAEQVRLGKQFGTNDIRELAAMFTMGGEIWQYVRPGVICTKAPLQTGPCNKRVARPEPSRCNCKCEHRLEEAALRDDVDRAIGDAVQFYKQDTAEGKEFQAEMWEGQILQNLHRFPDVRAKWMLNDVVAGVVAKNQRESV